MPVLGGTYDTLRGMRRGAANVRIKDFEIEVWPKRNFNRYSDRLIISCSDLLYNKSVIQSTKEQGQTSLVHDLILRSLIIKKEPLKQFESALINFPIIELSLQTNYTSSMRADKDHYKVLEARDYDDYVRILQEYSTK